MKCGQHFGAKRFREYRASWALVHEAVRSDRHDQHIAKRTSGF